VVIWCAVALRWDWIPEYAPLALEGLWRTIWILVVTCVLGVNGGAILGHGSDGIVLSRAA